jgi:hypothetical protein
MSLGIFRPHNKIAHPLGSVSGLGAIFYGNTTPDSKVSQVQNWLNGYLKQFGYSLLNPDGKLGKATCGACAWAFGQEIDLNTAPQSFFEVWNVCASSSQEPPTPLTAVAKTSAYTQGVQAMQSKAGDPAVVTAAQQALNVGLLAKQMCAIGVDGAAGPTTCGAQTWMIANAGGDGLTQAQRDAIYPVCSVGKKTAPGSCPVSAQPVVVVPPSPGPIGPDIGPVGPSLKPKMSAATMIAGVGVVAVLSAAWYVYSHKKAAGA